MAQNKQKLSNQEPKGTRDWLPEEFLVRKYIFDVWRKVCLSYGFQEYLTPIIENAAIYKAKSGEDIGGKELMLFSDQAGRELAIRPEMTPSVTRLITKIYDSAPKPIKYFSIANFIRNEKPQRGRNREFWQLNFDIFGADSLEADLEVVQIGIDIMLAFNAPKDSFRLYLNNRRLLDDVLDLAKVKEKNKQDLVRVLDKKQKMNAGDFLEALRDLEVGQSGIEILNNYLDSSSLEELETAIPALKDKVSLAELKKLIADLNSLGYGPYIAFNGQVIRGFDYYDGIVYEVFDLNPDNNRALFGGGRYNGLADIFGQKSFPAVGMAPGDETTKLFLESWHLINLEKINSNLRYYLPLLDKNLLSETRLLAKKLRGKKLDLDFGFNEQKIGKALDYANKKGFDYVVIFGELEQKKGIYKVKDMKKGEEKEFKF